MDEITPGYDPVTRRSALRLFGSALGGAALAGASAGLLSPADAATAVVRLDLDKHVYQEGELMTLVVIDTITAPDSRRLVVRDSTGGTWHKVSDDGRRQVFTARAGPRGSGATTVKAKLTRSSDGATFTASTEYWTGVPTTGRFPGDRPGTVMMGLAVTDKSNSNLQWEQATRLLGAAGGHVAVRRCFLTGWMSKSNIDKWANWAEANDVYPVISFKVPGRDWAGVAAGKYDSGLDLLSSTLRARHSDGRAPVCVAVHHEPAGDGDLPTWARMQEYLSNRFAPSNDIFCFSTISNGYDWGPHRGGTGEVQKIYPQSLIRTLNRNGHILGCDTYDSESPSKLAYSQYDRTSLKIAGFVAWARAQGVQRIGLGEFGCHNDIDLEKCWAIINANRDLFAYACHFNSGQNSRADWRMIPANYPPDPAVNSYTDRGGSAASAARLAAGVKMYTASVRVG